MRVRFQCEGGFTFGALREECKTIDRSYGKSGPFSIRVEGAVVTGSEAVRIAREAFNVAIELNKDDEVSQQRP